MEPIRLWRANVGTEWRDVEPHPLTPAQPGVWLPRADFDALVKAEAEREVAVAKAAVIGGEWCAKNRAEGRSSCGSCSWCCAQATARAEKAEALLVEASGAVRLFLRLLGKAHEIVMPSIRGLFALSKRRARVEEAVARIEAHLEKKS